MINIREKIKKAIFKTLEEENFKVDDDDNELGTICYLRGKYPKDCVIVTTLMGRVTVEID